MRHPHLRDHYLTVLRPMLEGRVVPFLGAGVNLCGRPRDPVDDAKLVPWEGSYLPSGFELMEYLVNTYGYPRSEPLDLLRVSQYVAMTSGTGPLYRELRRLLVRTVYPITAAHQFLAALPTAIRATGNRPAYPDSVYPLIITTNYDDVMEHAFDAVGEPYDLVYYAAQGPEKGRFIHRAPGEAARALSKPNKYKLKIDGEECLLLQRRPVILKIHGAVDRHSPERDSYVITEDDYIDYLTLPELTTLLPLPLPEWLNRCHFLFLGYSLTDWNMRAFFRRIWKDNSLSWNSWAVEIKERPLDQKFWSKRNVEVVVCSLEDYFADQGELLKGWCPRGSLTS
jgi:SIR2-like domain